MQLDSTNIPVWLQSIIMNTSRELEGEEYEQVLLMLSLTEPVLSYNNQRFFTDQYLIGDIRYDVMYFDEDKPIIKEYREIK